MNDPRYSDFLKGLKVVAPEECSFSVGDIVTYTNEFGVSFSGREIIGFANDSSLNGRFIHLANDAWWFPVRPSELVLESKNVANNDVAVTPVVSNENMKTQIELIAEKSFESGLVIEIDSVLPTVFIHYKNDKESGYFFQESEADGILHEAESMASFYDVSVENFLAYISQSW